MKLTKLGKTKTYKRGERIGIPLHDATVYTMQGPDFQKRFVHRVPRNDSALAKALCKAKFSTCNNVAARMSLTFRATGDQPQPPFNPGTLPGSGELRTLATGIDVNAPPYICFGKVSAGEQKNVCNFKTVYRMVESDLIPDITVFCGTHLNNGRMCATYELRDDDSKQEPITWYSYGGKKVPVRAIPDAMKELLHIAERMTNAQYNWVHVVYYPDGNCKLSEHADDEKEITPNSVIAGLSLYENVAHFRTVEIRSKPVKKVKTDKNDKKDKVSGKKRKMYDSDAHQMGGNPPNPQL